MSYLETAVSAAREAGESLRRNFRTPKDVDSAVHHDIKLALDSETQELITNHLLKAYPDHAIYGEEGIAGDQGSPLQWIVDPIDGTVNFFYEIPHFCVSIALREAGELIAGVIYDPMVDELWAVEKGGVTTLNGDPCQVSTRDKLEESMLFVGFGKDAESLKTGVPRFQRASQRARKMRMMGSAALGMAYVASGRLDAYIESRISLWDVAAGQILVEAAGGKVELTANPEDPDVYSIVATNGKMPVEEIL